MASLQQPLHYSPATSADLALLDMLTTQATPSQGSSVIIKRPLATLAALRRPPIDPIILAASLSTGPHVTRHHFHHSYGAPRPTRSKQMPVAERRARREAAAQSHSIGGYASCNVTTHDDALVSSSRAVTEDEERALYASRQAPRSVRIKAEAAAAAAANAQLNQTLDSRQASIALTHAPSSSALAGLASIVRPPPLSVRCYARTRIPTPHGEVFCHLYRNNHDAKEHLALVVDPAQNSEATQQALLTGSGDAHTKNHLRSCTLDEKWSPQETEMERIVRGAYVGRLSPGFQQASSATRQIIDQQQHNAEAPLVRIHSECYTGETIGSQRCDCGEQLDEAIRLIHAAAATGSEARGVVVYLRQEGRGIGLLDKLMAYNLQDMGHDTVSANVLLGHLPDARKYDVAAAILRDLGVGACQLLTNNPDKMEALEREGVRVTQRVAMIPRAWREELGQASTRRKAARRKASRATKSSTLARRTRKNQPLDASILSQAPSPRADSPHTSAFASAVAAAANDSAEEQELDSSSCESDEAQAEAEAEYVDHVLRRSGATMLGASVTRGVELEKYLRTKVERMGHMLDLPPPVSSGSSTPALEQQHSFALAHAPGETHPLAQSSSLAPLTPSTDDGAPPLGSTAAAAMGEGNGTDPDSLLGEEELEALQEQIHTHLGSQPASPRTYEEEEEEEEEVLVERRPSAL